MLREAAKGVSEETVSKLLQFVNSVRAMEDDIGMSLAAALSTRYAYSNIINMVNMEDKCVSYDMVIWCDEVSYGIIWCLSMVHTCSVI